jgi:predicted ester cyclase
MRPEVSWIRSWSFEQADTFVMPSESESMTDSEVAALPQPTRPAHPNKHSVWRLIEDGFNRGDLEVTEKYCHPDCVNAASIVAVPTGPPAIGSHIANARAGIPDLKLCVVGMVADGDEVAVLWQTRGGAGGYFGDDAAGVQSSAWLMGYWAFEDRLVHSWDAIWEPLRLLWQTAGFPSRPSESRAAPGSSADLSQLVGLDVLRSNEYPEFRSPDEQIVDAGLIEDGVRSRLGAMVEAILNYEFGDASFDDARRWFRDDCFISFGDHRSGHGIAVMSERRHLLRGAFSPSSLRIGRILTEPDQIAVRWRMSLRHVREYLGIVATGRSVEISGTAYGRCRDGQLVEWIELIDLLSLVRSLGGLSDLLPGNYPHQLSRAGETTPP